MYGEGTFPFAYVLFFLTVQIHKQNISHEYSLFSTSVSFHHNSTFYQLGFPGTKIIATIWYAGRIYIKIKKN